METSRTEPKVKICGLTNLADAERAVGLGAWALGVIFYDSSPRRCEVEQATEIAAAFKRTAEICGVFVNAELDYVNGIADRVGLSMLQFHGDEGPVYCATAANRTGCKVIKAVGVQNQADARSLGAFYQVDYHLLDSRSEQLRGGTGKVFNWDLIKERPKTAPLILSGGLNAENVSAAITQVHPYAVDVASGVEVEPGRKDPSKLEAFFAAVATTTNGSATTPVVA